MAKNVRDDRNNNNEMSEINVRRKTKMVITTITIIITYYTPTPIRHLHTHTHTQTKSTERRNENKVFHFVKEIYTHRTFNIFAHFMIVRCIFQVPLLGALALVEHRVDGRI